MSQINFMDKVGSVEQTLNRVRAWRAQGQRVIFTNGVFDVLHRGHVSYLDQARALGDRLVVGLNTDASAKRLNKGPDRPLNPEADRAMVMAALESVNAVTWFDEDTPLALIEALRPDVIVKGGDYDMDRLPETALVKTWGGQAKALPFVAGYSTTQLVERIRATHKP
jgi:rfaE bifunctional protein nucleotidyltransferase chain/domain